MKGTVKGTGLYIEVITYVVTSQSWDSVDPETMRKALYALRRILGKPDEINSREMTKGV